MNVLKMGCSHKEGSINCQDATGEYNGIFKVVCDGCSEGQHSEIGAKLFCKLLVDRYKNFVEKGKKYIDVPALMMSVMDELVQLIGDNPEDIKDYLSFTTLVVEKDPESNNAWVNYCGDGYIIVNKDDSILFKKLDCGKYPKYLSYNYVDGSHMADYKDGVSIDVIEFEDITNIGVASDGIRFVADLEDGDQLKEEFKQVLLSGKDMRMKLFFNRNERIFQDDFSVVM